MLSESAFQLLTEAKTKDATDKNMRLLVVETDRAATKDAVTTTCYICYSSSHRLHIV